jgi:hypothetical protein
VVYTGGYEHLLAHARAQSAALHFDLYFTLDGHDQLIDGMDEVCPDLARGIGPNVAAEAPSLPIVRHS